MKNKLIFTLSILFLLAFSACVKDENMEPTPPPTNRIDYLLVDEAKEQLRIFGQFPDDRGTVTINNQALAVKQWSRNLIICSIPYEMPHDYGNVVVSSSDTKSAPRRLYKWVIDFKSVRPHGGLTSDIVEEAHGSVTVRGDIHPAPVSVFTEDCTDLYFSGEVYYSAGGTANSTYDFCNELVAVWDPVNDLVVKSQGIQDLHGKTHFQGHKNILADGFDLYLDFLEWDFIPMTLTIHPCGGGSSTSQKKWSSQLIGMDGYDPIPLRFDPVTHNIQADSITEQVYNSTQLIWDEENGDAYRRTATFSWQSTLF